MRCVVCQKESDALAYHEDCLELFGTVPDDVRACLQVVGKRHLMTLEEFNMLCEHDLFPLAKHVFYQFSDLQPGIKVFNTDTEFGVRIPYNAKAISELRQVGGRRWDAVNGVTWFPVGKVNEVFMVLMRNFSNYLLMGKRGWTRLGELPLPLPKQKPEWKAVGKVFRPVEEEPKIDKLW